VEAVALLPQHPFPALADDDFSFAIGGLRSRHS
jgi:hypothetical protein